jgi:TAP-like protein/Bacterial transcriptional activator domain
MQALAASGHRTEALAAYARLRDRLRDLGGREPSLELNRMQRTLLGQAVGGDVTSTTARPPPAPVVASERVLPPEPLTSFVGRDDELATLESTLTFARIVTLHGSGGVGKTRIALHGGVFFTTTAQDWKVSERIERYLDGIARAYERYPNFWFMSHLYYRVKYALYPLAQQGYYRGPFNYPKKAAPALVIRVTHDARTQYEFAERYTEMLGNARLLTYDGDTHGALTGLNPCVFFTAFQYLNDLTLPAEGTTCTQHYEPFPSTEESPSLQSRSGKQPLPEQWRRFAAAVVISR